VSEPAPVSVIVPTLRRTAHLRRCLDGLLAQSRPPRQIVVVRRSDDEETATLLRVWRDSRFIKEVTVSDQGFLAALIAGVRASDHEVLAFTDDDAVPRPDWLDGLLACLADPTVGGVGGRDVIHTEKSTECALTEDVGRITSWGKLIGNHHAATGPARDVSVLKGVNMAFRREALAIPVELRGVGAQVHSEIAVCLSARNRGWRVVFDPGIVVDHFPGPRFDRDRREAPEPEAVRDAAYNLVACMLSMRPDLLWRRASYGLLVGDWGNPGIGRAVIALLRGERDVTRRFVPSCAGQAEALRDFARGRRIRLTTFERASIGAEGSRRQASGV
jgi:GT2 family glycosyltransferase